MRALLIGNYGVGNLGDEALCAYFLRSFPDVQWQVCSAHPTAGQLHRLPGGVRSFFTTPWWHTVRALRQTDAVVFGGGTLLTDIESSYACFLWAMHVFVARMLGKPVFLAFQGIGPFRTHRGRWLARKAVNVATFVSVRDAAAWQRVESWNLNSKVVQSFDPIYKEIYNQKRDRTKNILILIPRENSTNSFENAARQFLQEDTWDSVRILSLAPTSPSEKVLCQSLARQIPHAVIVPVSSLATLVTEIAQAAFVLTERYHGGIAALALHVPFAVVCQEKGDKLSSLTTLTDAHARTALVEQIKQGEDALRDALRYHAHSFPSKE